MSKTYEISILKRFAVREERTPRYLANIFENYNQLIRKNKDLDERNHFLENENIILKKSTADPKTLENLRNQISELQIKLSASYEDITKIQTQLINSNDKLKELSESNNQMQQESQEIKKKLSETTQSLEIKGKECHELTTSIKEVRESRNKLY